MKTYYIFERARMVWIDTMNTANEDTMKDYMKMYFGINWETKYKVLEVVKELKA